MNNYQKTTLPNGLRVITVPMNATKTVTVLVLVAAGSKYETKANNGISHFLEHMFFKGTKKRANNLEIAEALDRVGGKYNAFTGQEVTGYWAKVEAGHMELALDWVSDLYLNSLIKTEDIEADKKVIVEEINMNQDTPMRHIEDLWITLLYGNQPAGWPIAGTEKTVKSFKRDQFIDYLKNHYTAANTVVVVAGNIDKNKTQKEIKKYFAGASAKKPKNKLKTKEKQTSPKSSIHYKDTDQTHLILGVRGYNLFHRDKYAIGLLATILGGYMSSRLWQAVRLRESLGYYVSVGSENDTDVGCLVAQAGIDNKRVARAIEVILEEYKKIRDYKVPAQELKKAKDNIIGSTAIGMESSDAQASFYASQELLTGKIETVDEKFKKIRAVTVNDIQRVAKDIFQPQKLNLALIGPFKNKKTFDKLINSSL